MIAKLWEWFIQAQAVLMTVLNAIAGVFRETLAWCAAHVWVPMLGGILVVAAVYHGVISRINELMGSQNGSAADGSDGAWSSMWANLHSLLEYADCLFPVETMVGSVVSLGAWCLVVGVYRVVKSWIPTVSGS